MNNHLNLLVTYNCCKMWLKFHITVSGELIKITFGSIMTIEMEDHVKCSALWYTVFLQCSSSTCF